MEDKLKDADHFQDRIFELEAEKRRLLNDIEDLKRENDALQTQLGIWVENAETLSEAINNLDAPLSVRGSDEEWVYRASRLRKHFHRPNCEWAAYIPEHNLIEFGSHAEAVQADYKPCKTCRA